MFQSFANGGFQTLMEYQFCNCKNLCMSFLLRIWNYWYDKRSCGTISYHFVDSSGAPVALRWRHNDRDGVSNHQPRDCLLNRLFRRRSKKTSKLRVTGLCAGNSPGTGEFPAQMASYAENVSIWWRRHGSGCHCQAGLYSDNVLWYLNPVNLPFCY